MESARTFADIVNWVKSIGILEPVAFIIIYNIATLLFVPGVILTLKGGCLFGSLASIATLDMSNRPITETQIVQWVMRIIGVIATVAVTIHMTRIAKKALNQSISEANVHNKTNH